jgi:hypothetical protein
MSNHKIYSVFCDSTVVAVYLNVERPDRALCAAFGPANWREPGGSHKTSATARRGAQKEGWKRVEVPTGYGRTFCDLCPACFPVLEPALKAVQS